MDDIMIIDLFFERDDSAIRELEAKYGVEIKKHARRYLTDRRDAEEAYNDTLYEVWNSIPPKRPTKLLGYVITIVERKAIDKLRYLGRKKRLANEEVLFSEFEDIERYIGHKKADVSAEEMLLGSNLSEVNDFLEKESVLNRRIFLKRYYFGKSMSEIAREHKTTESAVYTRLSRTRSRLYEYLKKKGVIVK